MSGADTAWVLMSSALVLFMTIPGLSLFYGGLVQRRNVLSVLLQCFAITCVASLLWVVCGYSLAFSEGNALIGGLDKAMFAGMTPASLTGSIPEPAFALFQMTFAIITPALVIGAFAERVKFSAVLLFSVLFLLFIYAPVAHWIWGGGWLAQLGYIDFAGGTVVHITAGVSALVFAKVVGPREHFENPVSAPHNLTMTMTGAGMLWVGWLGFNGGSALGANGEAAMAALVTHISAAAAALTWTLLEANRTGKATAFGAATGMVAGLGTITPAAGVVGPGGAMVIGFLAALVCFFATYQVKHVLKIDDALDVFPVHGVGGILGTLLAAIFASPALGSLSGQGYAPGVTMGSQFAVQVLGALTTIAYTAAVSWVIWHVVQRATGWRVSEQAEQEGLDLSLHAENGYAL